jgi:hypothetical protein
LLEFYSDLPSSTTYCATIWNLLGENVSKDHAFNYVVITNDSVTLKRTIPLCSCCKYEQPIYVIPKLIMLLYSYWGADGFILIKLSMPISKFINHNSSTSNVPRYVILKMMSQNSETGVTSRSVMLVRKEFLFRSDIFRRFPYRRLQTVVRRRLIN